jgi:two-component system, NarL family, nitrate/nitrite response regulator NarL
MAIRCLIVDDNPRFAQTAREVLREDGIDVVAVASGSTEAVQLARELRPDLALVDIDLGGESGLDVARRLRADEPRVLADAVILISTHAREEFAELIAASPAVGFIAKAELSADAIEALLSRPASERTE